jgi:hypothetical protein
MARKKYLRMVATLCLYCLRQMAYYRAGWRRGSLIRQTQFWVAVNGNFIDICVLEWCKLFGDLRGKHSWKKAISDPEAFKDGLLQHLEMTEAEFNAYVVEMRTYRDKYVAHLDLVERFNIPQLDIAKKSVVYFYSYLLAHEDQGGYFSDAPRDAYRFYEDVLREGLSVYRTGATT